LETVQLLLNNGADKNISDSSGNTALIYAQLKKHAKIVKLLQDAKPTYWYEFWK
jgi:ankyrin repeat protein